MLSLEDYHEKMLVFIQSEDSKDISFRNENLLLTRHGKIINQLSCHKIFAVFIVGETTLTSVFIRKALSFGISVVLMRKNFSTYSVLEASTEGNTLLRKKQYSLNDTLPMAQKIVENKLKNQIALLQKLRGKDEDIEKAIETCRKAYDQVGHVVSLQELLGYEGTAAKSFFQTYFRDYGWLRRMPRTKCDITNTLMDIGYTFLFHFIDAHLRLYGFDNYVGVYHQEFYMRKSLVCDIEEPFRGIIDHAIRKAWNLKQINPKDFHYTNGQYELEYKFAPKYTKIFFDAIMEHKDDIFLYVKGFYRFMIRENEPFPEFVLKK